MEGPFLFFDPSRIFAFTFNGYALLSFTASALNLGLALYIFFRTPPVLVNRLFALFLFCLVVWGVVAEGMSRMSENPDAAYFWATVGAPSFIFMAPIFLHFTLLFTGVAYIAERFLVIFALYVPPIFFLFLYWRTNVTQGFPEEFYSVPWGWESPQSFAERPLYSLFTFWVVGLLVVALGFVLRFYRKSKADQERKQALLISVGLAVPLVAGTVTQVILPVLGISIVGLSIIFTTALAAAVFYAIRRLKLFLLSPTIALDTILSTMNEALFVIDSHGVIEFANRAAERLLGYKQAKIFRAPFSQILAPNQENELKKTFAQLNAGQKVLNIEFILRAHDERAVPLSISAMPLRDSRGDIVTFLFLGRDILEQKKLMLALAERRTDLREARENLEKMLAQARKATA